MLLAAFTMHNVTGGPQFIANNMDIVYTIILGNLAQVVLLMAIGLAFLAVAGNIVRVPLTILIPSVMILAILGSYAITGDIAGPVTLFVFAALGWLMKRYHYPVAATVVGLLLGRMVETQLIRTYQLSAGFEWQYFIEHPVTLIFLTLLAASLLQPTVSRRLRRARR
jgi:putative tricarboxylic transport membrane protein